MTEGLTIVDDKHEIIRLKVEVFDIIRKLEMLQYTASQLVKAKEESLKKIVELENKTYPPDKEGE